jgi:hypothetical protein
VWVAMMAIKLFLYFNDPLRRFYAPRQRHRPVRSKGRGEGVQGGK